MKITKMYLNFSFRKLKKNNQILPMSVRRIGLSNNNYDSLWAVRLVLIYFCLEYSVVHSYVFQCQLVIRIVYHMAYIELRNRIVATSALLTNKSQIVKNYLKKQILESKCVKK